MLCALPYRTVRRRRYRRWVTLACPCRRLCPPLQDSSSEVIPALGYARLPLPSVDNSLMPELVWVPALPQPTGRAVDREVPVPRWRLAREGPFLEERSTESIRSLGPGCAFRNTTYHVSDYAEPAGDYGLLLNHPRFVEIRASDHVCIRRRKLRQVPWDLGSAAPQSRSLDPLRLH